MNVSEKLDSDGDDGEGHDVLPHVPGRVVGDTEICQVLTTVDAGQTAKNSNRTEHGNVQSKTEQQQGSTSCLLRSQASERTSEILQTVFIVQGQPHNS